MTALPSWARKGVKVVCVDAVPRLYRICNLVEGAIYTIKGVGPAPTGELGLWLDEIASQHTWSDGRQAGYFVDRFRPAVEPKSEAHDVAQFRKLLTARTPETVE